MTIISLQHLATFLNKYNPKGRVGDFGGTSNIGAEIVAKMLALKNVSVKAGVPGPGFSVLVDGVEKRKLPEYLILDYDNGIDLLKPIKGKKFDAGICMDLLEHTSNPFIVATNIINSLKPGAMLFVTAPFAWELHSYPSDYFRFTAEGMHELFKKMKKISIETIRDPAPEEELPRTRIVAVFKKI